MKRRSAARISVNSRDPDHRGDVGDNRLLITDQTQGLLIWNDLSNVLGYLRVASDSGHATAVTVERLLRRLITLIYAGRNRMVVIRRELPRTKRADPARRPAA